MIKMTEKVIVLGSNHYNTIGMVQSLGSEGVYVVAVTIGKAGLLKRSNFVKEIYEASDFNHAIDIITGEISHDPPLVIIPCGDEAALMLERNSLRLKKNFLYQYATTPHMIEQAMNKNFQVQIAKACGLNVPLSYEVDDIDNLPNDMIYPCIIKPLLSCEGDKRNICVARNSIELNKRVKEMLTDTPRVIVQQFIENKEKELNILGCAFSNGSCEIPLSIEKLRTYPKGRGSVSVGKVIPLNSKMSLISDQIKEMVRSIGFVGLFSVELIVENFSNKIYFIEMNLRNDALNPFILKAGINLPYLHYQDLTKQDLKKYLPSSKERKMICEPIHLSSLYHKDILPLTWLKDIITSSFMLYNKNDKSVFWHMILDKFRSK